MMFYLFDIFFSANEIISIVGSIQPQLHRKINNWILNQQMEKLSFNLDFVYSIHKKNVIQSWSVFPALENQGSLYRCHRSG